MASLRQLRQRIKSVQNTKKLTRAMQMVAGAKLRRFESAVLSGRPYAEGVRALLERLASSNPELSHPLFERGAAGRKTLLVVSSDTGLCGAYNSHLFKMVERFLDDHLEEGFSLALVGRKANVYFKRRPYPISQSWVGLRGREGMAEVAPIGQWLLDAFRGGGADNAVTADEVWVASTHFRSAGSYVPKMLQWLPVEVGTDVGEEAGDTPGGGIETVGAAQSASRANVDYIVEPDPQQVLNELVEPCLMGQLYMLILSAFASEQAARMMAMKSATDNATEVGRKLTLLSNKIRQASITTQILEVVGGAEALK